MDALNNTYLFTSILLSILLITSELLGWSRCDAKAITQLHRCLGCYPKPLPEPETPTVLLVATDWSE